MKRLFLLAVLCLSLAALSMAADFMFHSGTKEYTVVSDSSGDSTASTSSFGAFRTDGFSSLQADIILDNATPAYAGLGNQDSGWIWLYTYMALANDEVLIDSAVTGGLPCTLSTVLHSNVGDTLIRENLKIKYQVWDSLSDTSISFTYPVRYRIKLK